MTKTILGVLSLLVIMSCSIPVKENTVQPNIMETNKKNLGNLLALYPKPMTVVGAEVEGKVNWLVVGHTGVIGHDRILISMSKSHYTNQGIKDSKRLSVNLVSREILPKADYVGSVSGATVDKSEVFAYHIGENGTPVIDASPLTMECEVVDIYETEGFDNFICAIVNTYAAPEVLDNNGKLDYTKLYLDEYMKYATEVGEISLRTESGVLTMYAVGEKENPCKVTILETYASHAAYEKHIASEHFQKYKQGTLHMVKSLVLSDQTPLNPANKLNNFMQ